jgi:N6-adenosine-specific RNA methylase IME4
MTETSLAIMTNASKMLAEATTIQKSKELKDLALTAADWAKRKGMGEETIRYCTSYAYEAERRMGEILRETERNNGGDAKRKTLGTITVPSEIPPTLAELGLTKKESSSAQFLASLPEETFSKITSGEMTANQARTETKRMDVIAKLESIQVQEAKAVIGVYDVIVIDPPWDMKKIERDVAPDQVEFEYPTMTDEEIRNLSIPCADNCHVWLWTTHKKLPFAFELLSVWGLKYVCTFVWHKPGGFQPFGLPQYNCEFALYARRGSPLFTETKQFNTCFNAPRGEHSEKPEEFYEVIRRVTVGRRLDMFNRRKIEGFDTWGKEAA